MAREKLYENRREEKDDVITDAINQREIKNQLAAMLDQIGQGCKKLLVLYYYDELPMKDVAEQLSFSSEQVARNKKYKCMKELADLLAENPALAKEIQAKVFNH